METRNIVIVDTASNRQVNVQTNATTFGELKNAVLAAGVDIEGKDWLEGITKTSPMGDDSLLPTNVTYKGNVTNNLVYMLTNTNKKVRSGSGVSTRTGAYLFMKSNPEVAAAFKARYGRNYTNGTTVMLINFINDLTATAATPSTPSVDYKGSYESLVYAVSCMLTALNNSTIDDINACCKNLEQEVAEQAERAPKNISFSKADINEMFE